MLESRNYEPLSILNARFGRDTVISLATMDGNRPAVRMVNSFYEEGAFYTVTYAHSNKMKQIEINAAVAVCGEWFTAYGVGENIGHPYDDKNVILMTKLRDAFQAWYDNGHINENDPHTCILCVHLAQGVLYNDGKKYNINFDED